MFRFFPPRPLFDHASVDCKSVRKQGFIDKGQNVLEAQLGNHSYVNVSELQECLDCNPLNPIRQV